MPNFCCKSSCSLKQIDKQDIQLSTSIPKIPEGGSLRFEYTTSSGSRGKSSELSSRTTGYGSADSFTAFKQSDGTFRVDVSKDMTSVFAIIKDKNGQEQRFNCLKIEDSKSITEESNKVQTPKVESQAKSEQEKVSPTRSLSEKPTQSAESLRNNSVMFALAELSLPYARRFASEAPTIFNGLVSRENTADQIQARMISNSANQDQLTARSPISDPLLASDSSSQQAEPQSKNKVQDFDLNQFDAEAAARDTSATEESPFKEANVVPTAKVKNDESLDINKLKPGQVIYYISKDNNNPNAMTVPSEGSVEFRGNFVKNDDGSMKFVPDSGEELKFSLDKEELRGGQGEVAEVKSEGKQDVRLVEPKAVATESKLKGNVKIERGKVNELSGDEAKQFAKDNPDVSALVIVGAEWCGPCQGYKPSYTDYARANPEKVIIHVDSDRSRSFVSDFGISGIPATLVKRAGQDSISKLESSNVGPMSRTEMETRFGK